MNSQNFFPPFKNVATSLLLTVLLGPVGLLYSSFWGGLLMVSLFMLVSSGELIFPMVLIWVICSIWGVSATETYNRKNWLMRSTYENGKTIPA